MLVGWKPSTSFSAKWQREPFLHRYGLAVAAGPESHASLHLDCISQLNPTVPLPSLFLASELLGLLKPAAKAERSLLRT